MAADSRKLPDDVEALKALIAAQQARIRELEHAVHVLTRMKFAPKSERRAADGFALEQGQMHLLVPELIEAAERVADEMRVEGTVEVRSEGQSKRPRRRKHFPPHLPVIRSTFELPEDQRGCGCGAKLEPIGEEVSR